MGTRTEFGLLIVTFQELHICEQVLMAESNLWTNYYSQLRSVRKSIFLTLLFGLMFNQVKQYVIEVVRPHIWIWYVLGTLYWILRFKMISSRFGIHITKDQGLLRIVLPLLNGQQNFGIIIDISNYSTSNIYMAFVSGTSIWYEIGWPGYRENS